RAAANQHQPDAVQVRILLGGSCRQELLADHALDVLGPPPLARDSARDALREVRLAAGPYVDPLEYRAPDAQVVAEAGRERQALLEREIGGLDREPADERREGRSGAGRGGRCGAEPGAVEPRVVRIADAPRVARVDRRVELLRERQREGALDLVDEDRDRHRRVRQHDVREELREPLLAGERALLLPPALQIELEAQLAQDAIRDRVAPARGGTGLAVGRDLAEVHDGGKLTVTPQRADRARHQARLSGRARGEHVTEALLADAPQQLRVGRALDVARPIRLDRPADDEIISGLGYLRHSGAIVGAPPRRRQCATL